MYGQGFAERISQNCKRPTARKAANPQVEPKIFHILVFPSFSSFIFLQRSLQIKQELLKNQILIFFVLFIQFVLTYS